jgi:long-chain fatty acid transport protein
VVLRVAPVAALAAALLTGPFAHASGTRVGYKDAFASARGDAFVATADDPSAVYYNPAGLTQLDGTQVSANVYEVELSSDYSGAGGSASLNDEYHAVPSFYTTWKMAGAPVAYGFGVYLPFGLSTDWPDNSPLRTIALRNVQKIITYNFSGAWQISPDFSVGAGIAYNHGMTDLRRAIGVFGPDDLFRFSGTGDALNFDVGFLWKVNAQNSLGATYTSQTSIKFKGTANTLPIIPSEPANATFDFPETLRVGWSFRPVPEWNFEADVDWTNWDSVGTVVINKASGPTALPFNWKSGSFYELGATRYLAGGWHASLGLNYTENSTPDATFNPAIPDGNKMFYCGGIGYKSERFSADLALQYGDGGSRHVSGSPPSLIGATADGTYQTSVKAVSLSLGLRF